jgi:hypothetical protein
MMNGTVIVRRRQGKHRYLRLCWESGGTDGVFLEWTDSQDRATIFESEEKVRDTLTRYPAGKELLDDVDIVSCK